MKIWNPIKRFFGYGKSKEELEIRATEIDSLVDAYKVEPTSIVVDVPKAELPEGIKVKKEATGNIVTEPKGINRTPKGITKGTKKGTKENTPGVTPAPAVEPDSNPFAPKEVKVAKKKAKAAPKAKKAPAKKVAKKAVEAKKEARVKRAWFNNGKEQKLIPVDQETATGWTKGKLPKGKSTKKDK